MQILLACFYASIMTLAAVAVSAAAVAIPYWLLWLIFG